MAFVYWLLFRTTIGYEFRAAGLNPDAARYAGMPRDLSLLALEGLVLAKLRRIACSLDTLARNQPPLAIPS